MTEIQSVQNPTVRRLKGLKDKKAREEANEMLVEGEKLMLEAAEMGLEPSDVLIEDGAADRFAALAERMAGFGARVYAVPRRVLETVCDTKTPQGVLALVKKRPYTMADVLQTGRPLIVLENLQDPGNMGTILRSLEAAGGGGLICDRSCTDIYSLKTIRATMGTLFRVPHVTVDDLGGTIGELKKNGYRIYAAHLAGDAYSTAVRYEEKSAFLIGNEGRGLSDEISALADQRIRIPMEGAVESLNAAVAASLLLYEVKRQLR